MAKQGSVMTLKKFGRRELFCMIKGFPNKNINEQITLFEKKMLEITNCPKSEEAYLSHSLSRFKSNLKKRWSAANYIESRFTKTNQTWLSGSETLPTWTKHTSAKPGGPEKDFCELSDRSKRRKTKDIREQVPPETLTYAAGCSQQTSGNIDAAKMIKEMITTPTRARKIRMAYKESKRKNVVKKKYTPAEALLLFVEADLTKRQYQVLQSANKDIYPCYLRIKDVKKECYPTEESFKVTETHSEVELQALLDHTVKRLCTYLGPVLNEIHEDDKQNLELIVKWGCDGSQQTQFKQKFEDIEQSDANIFQSSLVPIRLILREKVIWQNPSPGSVWFCRPIRIRFTKETKDVTKEEIEYIDQKCANLFPTIYKIEGEEDFFEIKHTLLPTMVDAKVCNAATDTSSTMRCYICGQTSKYFNKLLKVNTINTEALRFGMSTLHARIRFFESLLHLAYKLPFMKWQAKTAEQKKKLEETKTFIHEEFREKLGLLVDIPKQGGGNTNDGNSSRRFFSDPEISSQITKIDVDLIKRLAVILEVISSGFEVDVYKFGKYAMETAKLYVDKYEWHPMTPTLHKVLMHGSMIISHAIVPIGQLSEEAGEARNKHFRKYRSDFSRKFSRRDCNRDVLHRLLLTSDPLISLQRKKSVKKRKSLSKEALDNLIAVGPENPDNTTDHEPTTETDQESTDSDL